MMEVSTKIIEKAVYELCLKANICLNDDVYSKILNAYNNSTDKNEKDKLKYILQNAKIAFDDKMPLCQDTGQVIVFLEVGKNIVFTGDFIENAINSSVEKCYNENFFRKSVVKNAVFDRVNTKTNTPVIIHTKYINSNELKLSVLIKGAGSENKSKLEMMLPTASTEEIILKCAELILSAGINSCPPMFIGIGLGGTSESSLLMSKEVFIHNDFTKEENELALKIKNEVNNQSSDNNYVLDVKLKTSQTHIASMPVGITINCHSDRFSTCTIKDNQIIYHHKIPDFIELKDNLKILKEVKTSDVKTIEELKIGENILLTGEIFVARDMAHKKLIDLLHTNNALPFDLNDKIIFYAGPCPCAKNKVIGSIGPTTAGRMDKYAKELHEKGIIATIGKGSRNCDLVNYLSKNKKRYFSVQGGIASLLSKKVLKSKIIAFPELGTEAVYKIYVEKFPVKVEV